MPILVKFTCSFCGVTKEIKRHLLAQKKRCSLSGGIFCSLSCSSSFRLGDKNPNWKGGISENYYHYKKLQMQRYPERVAARHKAWRAVKQGVIKKLPCETCGDIDSQSHHEDYTKPLEVTWLCQLHHPQSKGNKK